VSVDSDELLSQWRGELGDERLQLSWLKAQPGLKKRISRKRTQLV